MDPIDDVSANAFQGITANSLMIVTQFSAGPNIGSTVVRSIVDTGSDRFVFVQYLPINRVLSDTEYKSALRSVQLAIDLVKPRLVLSLDDDYMKYMPAEIYKEYKDKFAIAYKGLATVSEPACDLIVNIANRTYNRTAPIYIMRDDNTAHIESARILGQCLRDKGHDVQQYSATTLAELKSAVFGIESRPRGFLISLVNTVSDTEFNRPIGLDEINRFIIKFNKNHIDIGFVRSTHNLSIVLIPSLDNLSTDNKWAKVKTEPRLYVSISRLDKVGGSLVYKNMFREISGVLGQ